VVFYKYYEGSRSGFGFAFSLGGLGFLKAAGSFELVVQNPLDLPVDAAEFIGRPLLQGLVSVFVYAQHK
jgi:hypothetical protein